MENVQIKNRMIVNLPAGIWPFKSVATALLGVLIMTTAVDAHHSMAMFDATKTIMIAGSVKSFKWTSPHPLMQLTVLYKSGPVDWTIEVSSLTTLMRAGWSPTSLKQGDKATVACHPLRNGDAGCNFVSLKFPDGKVMGLGASNVP